MSGIILFNKPYGVLSQFTDEPQGEPRPTLADYIEAPGFYATSWRRPISRRSKASLTMRRSILCGAACG